MCSDFDAASGCVSGLKESIKRSEVSVFPNPAHDKIHIAFEQSADIAEITILNTLGQEVERQLKPAHNAVIDISQLPAGLYFLKAENKQGYGLSKLVKE